MVRAATIAHAAAFLILTSAVAQAQDRLASIPASVPPAARAELTKVGDALQKRIDAHNAREGGFTSRCGEIPRSQPERIAACGLEFQAILAEADALEVDKKQFNTRVSVAAMMHGDPSVVDARVEMAGAGMVNAIPELARSPEASRIAKGFGEVIKHNWPGALVWWQDALNRDPANMALRRGVELAQWTIQYQTRAGNATLNKEYLEAYKLAYVPDSRGSNVPGTKDIYTDLLVEQITGIKTIDLSDEWWRDHGK